MVETKKNSNQKYGLSFQSLNRNIITYIEQCYCAVCPVFAKKMWIGAKESDNSEFLEARNNVIFKTNGVELFDHIKKFRKLYMKALHMEELSLEEKTLYIYNSGLPIHEASIYWCALNLIPMLDGIEFDDFLEKCKQEVEKWKEEIERDQSS